MQGATDDAVSCIHRALAELERRGVTLYRPCGLGSLAEALIRRGEHTSALAALEIRHECPLPGWPPSTGVGQKWLLGVASGLIITLLPMSEIGALAPPFAGWGLGASTPKPSCSTTSTAWRLPKQHPSEASPHSWLIKA